MALRNQPYLPLYVDDFLSDERLNECSAESTGVYIRLMCLMHKSQEYGAILLKQKDKQSGSTITDFAVKLVRQMPYTEEVIGRSLRELLEEDVLTLDGDRLFQRRMVKDAKLSDTRASAGRKGGCSSKTVSTSTDFADDFASAKPQANSVIGVVVGNGDVSNNPGNTEDVENISPAHAREGDEALGRVMTSYMNNINPMPSSTCVAELQGFVKELGADVCLRAIDTAIDARATKWNYVKVILLRMQKAGVKSLADWDAMDQQRHDPSSSQQDMQHTQPSRTELERMKKLRERFRSSTGPDQGGKE